MSLHLRSCKTVCPRNETLLTTDNTHVNWKQNTSTLCRRGKYLLCELRNYVNYLLLVIAADCGTATVGQNNSCNGETSLVVSVVLWNHYGKSSMYVWHILL